MMKVIAMAIFARNVTATAYSANNSEFPGVSGTAFVKMCSVVEKDSKDMTHLDGMKLMTCVGYVTGVVDGIEAEMGFADVQSSKGLHVPYCLADHVERGQLVKIVLKYVKDHPETSHLPTGALVLAAFREAFPCQQL